MLLVALALGLSGCAYFNTFHHAKRAFGKAQRAQEDSRSEKLSPEAVRYYDQAIEKCAKVIFEHGGGMWAGIDDALFLMGASYYGKREYDDALKKFRELLLNYPESDHRAEALFYTGLCYHRMRNYALAERTFERVLREHPDFERRDEILFTAAATLETTGAYDQALRSYARLLREFRKSRKREEVLERVADIHFEAGRYDSAVVAYRELAETTRDDDLYFEAQLNVGACLVRLGDYDRALDVYRRILPEQPERDEKGGRVWLAMADAENRKGDHAEALEYLGLATEHFEKRGVGVEASFQTAYTYETYLQDYTAAREHYESVTSAAGSSVFKDQAARRLKNLKYIEEMQATEGDEQSDDAQRAEAALKVAEFTLFEGRDSLAALGQYAEIVRDFPGTAAAVRAAYARGLVYRALDSLAVAGEALAEVVTVDPASAQAARAIALLEEMDYPEDRTARLRMQVRAAQTEQARRDSIAAALEAARADSLEAARAESLAAVAAADSLAAAAALGSPSAVADSVARLDAGAALEGGGSVALPEGAPDAPFTPLEADSTPLPPAVPPALDDTSTIVPPPRPPRPGTLPAMVDRHGLPDGTDIRDSLASAGDTLITVVDSLTEVSDSLGASADSATALPDSLNSLRGGLPPPDSLALAADSLEAVPDSGAPAPVPGETDDRETE